MFTPRKREPSSIHLKVGEVVEVRSVDEISAGLDGSGAKDRLPYMPEMLAFAGQRFTVSRRADTTCAPAGLRNMRDTVHLDALRCTGADHGGCQAACLLFWKESWLRRVDGATDSVPKQGPPDRQPSRSGASAPGCSTATLYAATRAPATTASDDAEEQFSCQATELERATTPLPWWDLRHFWRDVRSGSASWRDVLRYLPAYVFNNYQTFSRVYFPPRLLVRGGKWYPFVKGRLDKSMTQRLNLEPGERVRIKEKRDIFAVLHKNGHSRGLSFDVEMLEYCGHETTVRQRVNRVIDEVTGRMRHIPGDCIMLDGVVCTAKYHGLCGRQTYSFWRESWLSRQQGPTPSDEVGQAADVVR